MSSTTNLRIAGRISVKALVILGVIVVTVIGGLGLSSVSLSSDGSSPQPSGDTLQWYTVEPKSFELTVIETGDLDAAERVEIKSRVSGRPEIIYLIEEGTQVEAGDVLVRLDDAEITQKIEAELLKVQTARADEVYARQDLEIERGEATSAENDARVDLELAKLELAKWEQGDVPQMRRELQLELEKAERLVERTERDYELSKSLHEEKFISLNDLEDSEIEKLEASEGLKTAQLALEVYEKYTYETERQQNQSAVDQAEAALKKQLAKNESSLERLEAKLAANVRTLTIHETRLKELQDQLAATVVTAPSAGMVVYSTSVGRQSWRQTPMAEGRQVRENETMIFLPDQTQMVANLAVAETYEPIVQLGQAVRITLDARPGQVYHGEIDRISLLSASGGWLNPNQREFTVRVLLPPNTDSTLKPAMRCTGEITVGQVENQLAIPVQAVYAEGDQHYCYVPADGGRVTRRPIEIGQASETMVVILDGLTDGDRVLLREPTSGETQQG
jgi:HlyD family secretion protein